MSKSFRSERLRAMRKTKREAGGRASIRRKNFQTVNHVIPGVRPSLEPVFFRPRQKDTAFLNES
jgi:hypothetical protein